MSRTIIWAKLSSVWTEEEKFQGQSSISCYIDLWVELRGPMQTHINQPPQPHPPDGGLVPSSRSSRASCPDLELAGFGHVLDAFERFVLLSVHVQPVDLQPCGANANISETAQIKRKALRTRM